MTALPVLEKTSEMVPVAEIPTPSADLAARAAQGPLYTATETYSKQILGQTSFELYYLHVLGTKGFPTPPWHVAPTQSPYIIDTDEDMWVGLVAIFDRSPLTRLLMCLGTDICATFHFEGYGGQAAEKDLKVKITSVQNRFVYWIGTKIKPEDLGLTSGFYKVAATVEVGPLTHQCGQYVFGYGYIGERRVQIAEQPNYPLP
ncbi:MAG: hypothetical protein F6K19_38800 [Cyanothece sp. SIO1E1]|nr:hypothetical protein [Cyanothece sp. SIO1E1]